MHKAKILVLGPCESGKSAISNFLSESAETAGAEYHPTQGVRILEFEIPGLTLGGGAKTTTAEIELWDVSGDHKFEQCWPAIAKDANGIVFVFNPDQANHDKELESWFSYFVESHGIRDEQCITLAHHKEKGGSKDSPLLPSGMKKIPCVHSNIDDEGDALRTEFENYVGNLLVAMTDKREQEELSILE